LWVLKGRDPRVPGTHHSARDGTKVMSLASTFDSDGFYIYLLSDDNVRPY
jgi:hypothetical protein